MCYRVLAPAMLAVLFMAGVAVFEAYDSSGLPTTNVARVGGALAWGANGLAIGLLINLAVESRFRFTIRGLIWATAWAAAFCVGWRSYSYLLRYVAQHQERQYPLYVCLAANLLRYVPIPVAIASLFSRPWYGMAIGMGLFLIWFLISVILLYGNFVFI